jgi:hypothetical protein
MVHIWGDFITVSDKRSEVASQSEHQHISAHQCYNILQQDRDAYHHLKRIHRCLADFTGYREYGYYETAV